ncbi:hypothetical protein BDN72DRAFT_859229 [Pluteus cervinus]|uniref:Uncharacterized protein n=1 Tax=Pluteus cervinus TaxID=181527 RepID=A0ACD3ANV8_9AGAR|nr:hypothetical protein BDN72DRAFT_859229 [Pluteus cervinus]
MVNSKFIALTAALFVSPALAFNVPRTLLMPKRAPQGDSGTIAALLRQYPGGRGSGIAGRQADTCDPGNLPCADGNGCCPTGEYCGEWDGILGCCPNGQTCVSDGDVCEYQGHIKCTNENFCCQPGATCFCDSTGTPKCSAGPSPGGSAFVNGSGCSAGSTGNSTGSTGGTGGTSGSSGSTGSTGSTGSSGSGSSGSTGASGSSGSGASGSGASGSSGSSKPSVASPSSGPGFSLPSTNDASLTAGANALLAVGGFAVQAIFLA